MGQSWPLNILTLNKYMDSVKSDERMRDEGLSRPRPCSHTVIRVPHPEPFDPIAEADRQWSTRWPQCADHMAAVTSVMRVQQLLLSRLEQPGLVERQMPPDDRRVVLATITPAGRAVADEATAALNQAAFGLPELTQDQAAQATAILHLIRTAAGDV